MLVEPPRVVNQSPGNVALHGFIDRMEIGEDGLDSGCDEMLLSSHAHAARDQDGHTREGGGHSRMLVIVMMGAFAMGFRSERVMSGFTYMFAIGNTPILQRDDLIVECPAEM